jgi:DNA-directed RNA polymerase specialized sigma subunit
MYNNDDIFPTRDKVKNKRNRTLQHGPTSAGLNVIEISEIMGISHQRVTQILQGALAKMRKNIKLNGLTREDFI